MTGRTREHFRNERGVRQGDPISPELFSTVLEDLFRRLDCKEKGIKINGKRISHLRFTDDVVLTAETANKTENM